MKNLLTLLIVSVLFIGCGTYRYQYDDDIYYSSNHNSYRYDPIYPYYSPFYLNTYSYRPYSYRPYYYSPYFCTPYYYNFYNPYYSYGYGYGDYYRGYGYYNSYYGMYFHPHYGNGLGYVNHHRSNEYYGYRRSPIQNSEHRTYNGQRDQTNHRRTMSDRPVARNNNQQMMRPTSQYRPIQNSRPVQQQNSRPVQQQNRPQYSQPHFNGSPHMSGGSPHMSGGRR